MGADIASGGRRISHYVDKSAAEVSERMKRRIIAICAISLLSAGAAVVVLRYWLSDAIVEISAHGYIAMGLGVGFTVLLAFGLMSLVYFSARRGYDEDADQGRSEPRVDAPSRDKRT